MHRRILGEAGPTPWPFRWAAISLSLNLPRSSGRIGNRRRKSCVMVLSISVIASLRRREIEAGRSRLGDKRAVEGGFHLSRQVFHDVVDRPHENRGLIEGKRSHEIMRSGLTIVHSKLTVEDTRERPLTSRQVPKFALRTDLANAPHMIGKAGS